MDPLSINLLDPPLTTLSHGHLLENLVTQYSEITVIAIVNYATERGNCHIIPSMMLLALLMMTKEHALND